MVNQTKKLHEIFIFTIFTTMQEKNKRTEQISVCMSSLQGPPHVASLAGPLKDMQGLCVHVCVCMCMCEKVESGGPFSSSLVFSVFFYFRPLGSSPHTPCLSLLEFRVRPSGTSPPPPPLVPSRLRHGGEGQRQSGRNCWRHGGRHAGALMSYNMKGDGGR